MSDKELEYCPLCGSEITGGGFMTPWECEYCGEMFMEVWGYEPDFWHLE